jgi:hypothetical protein
MAADQTAAGSFAGAGSLEEAAVLDFFLGATRAGPDADEESRAASVWIAETSTSSVTF